MQPQPQTTFSPTSAQPTYLGVCTLQDGTNVERWERRARAGRRPCPATCATGQRVNVFSAHRPAAQRLGVVVVDVHYFPLVPAGDVGRLGFARGVDRFSSSIHSTVSGAFGTVQRDSDVLDNQATTSRSRRATPRRTTACRFWGMLDSRMRFIFSRGTSRREQAVGWMGAQMRTVAPCFCWRALH